jgi:hypothetical protein
MRDVNGQKLNHSSMGYTTVRRPVWLRGGLTGAMYAGIWVLTSVVVLGSGKAFAVLGGLIGAVIVGIATTLTMVRAEKAASPPSWGIPPAVDPGTAEPTTAWASRRPPIKARLRWRPGRQPAPTVGGSTANESRVAQPGELGLGVRKV